MDKLDKLKLASSSFSERLKTGGVQMSRLVSTKMKEILLAPTPESRIVDEATLETMEEPNWGLNLRICAMINSEEFNGTEIVKAIKKKIVSSKSAVSQRLSLDLLETCTSNCEKVFSEVASEKVLDDMVRMIQDDRTDHRNRKKAVQLIRGWGESEELMYLPVFRQTYLNLKSSMIPEGSEDGNSYANQTLESYVNQQPMSPPQTYPLPDMDLLGAEDDTFPYSYTGQSIEQKKEELVVARNSLDILTSILDSGTEPLPVKDELITSMLEKCKQSLPVICRIAETTVDDDMMLFEALNLHDELQQVVSRCDQIEGAAPTKPSDTPKVDGSSTTPTITVESPRVENTTTTEWSEPSSVVKEGSEVKVKVKDHKDENGEHEHTL